MIICGLNVTHFQLFKLLPTSTWSLGGNILSGRIIYLLLDLFELRSLIYREDNVYAYRLANSSLFVNDLV